MAKNRDREAKNFASRRERGREIWFAQKPVDSFTKSNIITNNNDSCRPAHGKEIKKDMYRFGGEILWRFEYKGGENEWVSRYYGEYAVTQTMLHIRRQEVPPVFLHVGS